MIRPEELRIGNIFQLIDSEIVTVLGIEGTEIRFQGRKTGSLSKGHFNPIPLTEEWLERLEFEKIFNTYDKSAFETGAFSLGKDDIGFYLTDKPNVVVKHVHQLQNLYFALTGQELELTPPPAQP